MIFYKMKVRTVIELNSWCIGKLFKSMKGGILLVRNRSSGYIFLFCKREEKGLTAKQV